MQTRVRVSSERQLRGRLEPRALRGKGEGKLAWMVVPFTETENMEQK